jgi:hypothetical protein
MFENTELLNLNEEMILNLNEEMNEEIEEIVMSSIDLSSQFRQLYFDHQILSGTLREFMPSIEFSSQLRQLYFEEQTLNGDLIQLMTEENNTRNRMEIVSTEINKLLRQKRQIDAPFVNVRRESQNEENISESCQLRKFYFENRVLSKFLRELMTQENNIRNRMVFVSRSINILLREMIAEQDEVKLKKNSCVKPIKELYSTMETHCAICLEDHQYIDVCTLPCNHEYGTKCFENWFSKGVKTCPECRNPTKEIKTYCSRAENAKIKKKLC